MKISSLALAIAAVLMFTPVQASLAEDTMSASMACPPISGEPMAAGDAMSSGDAMAPAADAMATSSDAMSPDAMAPSSADAMAADCPATH